MTDTQPLMIAIAPNGARKTQQDYPTVPISPEELANTASDCLKAGACMIHLHVRDDKQGHSLDPNRYAPAIAAIREQVGDQLIIQITTEAVGIYRPEEQIEVVKKVKPEAASIALKEFCPDESHEQQAAQFFEWMFKEGVAPQYILYDERDIERFNHFCERGLIPGDTHSILLVLGRYTENQESNVEDLNPLLEVVNKSHRWWLCAFGKTEAQCMSRAIELNGHCRVGFENNTSMPDGKSAAANHQLVEVVADSAQAFNRSIANADQARELMSFR
ncbi:MAG: 3-keto-5-aminohexanoate cleavage protein [Pseudomonadales bacterium]|nr:3-keto-5-aminohexanoate cleavage protein [Pseudomonadales bacterium]